MFSFSLMPLKGLFMFSYYNRITDEKGHGDLFVLKEEQKKNITRTKECEKYRKGEQKSNNTP